jgi:hypothetical protein
MVTAPLVRAGFSDWRLPNINELKSLYIYGNSDTNNFDGNVEFFFINTYWSSTTYAYEKNKAWSSGLSIWGAHDWY